MRDVAKDANPADRVRDFPPPEAWEAWEGIDLRDRSRADLAISWGISRAIQSSVAAGVRNAVETRQSK